MSEAMAYVALHYGKEFLPYVTRSLMTAGLETHIFYTDVPSYGHSTKLPCPDKAGELFEAAVAGGRDKVMWHSGRWSGEAAHRNHAVRTLKGRGARFVVVADSDEVWDPDLLKLALEYIKAEAKRGNGAARWSVPFFNFWRSQRFYVKDHFRPIRIVDTSQQDGERHLELPGHEAKPCIYHFGYAQSDAIMQYKWTCHGHQAELRDGWMEKYFRWQEGDRDLHPCVNNLWDQAYLTPPEVLARLSTLLVTVPAPVRDVERDLDGPDGSKPGKEGAPPDKSHG